MAGRTFKDAAATTRQALVHQQADTVTDVPVYQPGYGADGADKTTVSRTAGLPIVGQRTAGSPVTGKIQNPTASATTVGNSVAVGGTGGTALPGTFLVTADPDNTSLIVLGDSNANAAAKSGSTIYLQGIPLQPGQAYIIDTDDLRSWKVAVRIANDGLTYAKVGS